MHSTMNRGTAVREQGIAVARTVQADTVETSHEQKQDQVDPGTAQVSLANRAVATARVKLSHHVGLVTKVFTDTCVIKEQEQLINVYVENWPKDPTGNFLPLEKWGEGHGTAFHQFQQYYADEGLSAIGASMNALVRAHASNPSALLQYGHLSELAKNVALSLDACCDNHVLSTSLVGAAPSNTEGMESQQTKQSALLRSAFQQVAGRPGKLNISQLLSLSHAIETDSKIKSLDKLKQDPDESHYLHGLSLSLAVMASQTTVRNVRPLQILKLAMFHGNTVALINQTSGTIESQTKTETSIPLLNAFVAALTNNTEVTSSVTIGDPGPKMAKVADTNADELIEGLYNYALLMQNVDSDVGMHLLRTHYYFKTNKSLVTLETMVDLITAMLKYAKNVLGANALEGVDVSTINPLSEDTYNKLKQHRGSTSSPHHAAYVNAIDKARSEIMAATVALKMVAVTALAATAAANGAATPMPMPTPTGVPQPIKKWEDLPANAKDPIVELTKADGSVIKACMKHRRGIYGTGPGSKMCQQYCTLKTQKVDITAIGGKVWKCVVCKSNSTGVYRIHSKK